MDEGQWFTASDHMPELVEYMQSFQIGLEPNIHVLDLFGYSGKIAATWRKNGYVAEEYDVLRGGRAHDILSKRGFRHLLRCLVLEIARETKSGYVWTILDMTAVSFEII